MRFSSFEDRETRLRWDAKSFAIHPSRRPRSGRSTFRPLCPSKPKLHDHKPSQAMVGRRIPNQKPTLHLEHVSLQ
ncbi:uncharacterized protein L3040_007134 [Drepanopeziza brunnea f. sp. 'multigermtubi']|uniref:uncharacterized protein n=1 Tax=Drepanopeziza brunnea f. sp. 'multigermtubi' TaxID=698441 RepID=UPI0023905EAA|nr:hypothetical protein L3040_007134 [Drepanopeziza brunnea f. sp. 'multigermtubi']